MQDTHISIYLYQDLLHTSYSKIKRLESAPVLENQHVSALLLVVWPFRCNVCVQSRAFLSELYREQNVELLRLLKRLGQPLPSWLQNELHNASWSWHQEARWGIEVHIEPCSIPEYAGLHYCRTEDVGFSLCPNTHTHCRSNQEKWTPAVCSSSSLVLKGTENEFVILRRTGFNVFN